MTEWRCEILTREGRRDWRRVIAPSREDAATQLMAEGLVPVRVASGAMTIAERLRQPVHLGGAMGQADQALVLGQLAMLLRAGMPVDRSLDLLADQLPRQGQRDWLREALGQLRAGHSLAEALEIRRVLPAWVVGVIRSAEHGGRLAEALASLAVRIGEAAKARSELATALTYPAVVVGATLVALVVVLTLVVPQFEALLRSDEAALPLLTRVVLWLSSFVRGNGWLLLCALIALPIASVAAIRGGWLDRPGAAAARRSGLLAQRDRFLAARFSTLLSTLLANGVALVPALPFVRDAMGSRRWQQAVDRIAQRVREGVSFTEALGDEPVFPRTAIRLIEVGERSGALDRTLADAGHILHQSAAAQLQRFIALANPIAILALGIIVALLVAGVLLGIFSVGELAQ